MIYPALLNSEPDRKEMAIRQVVRQYGLTKSGEALIRAICDFENGAIGKQCGHMHPYKDREVQDNPCLPEYAYDQAKTARAMTRCMQSYIFSNEWQTREFVRYFASWYHSSPKASDNRRYARTLLKIFRQYEPLVDREYDPEKPLKCEECDVGNDPGRGASPGKPD